MGTGTYANFSKTLPENQITIFGEIDEELEKEVISCKCKGCGNGNNDVCCYTTEDKIFFSFLCNSCSWKFGMSISFDKPYSINELMMIFLDQYNYYEENEKKIVDVKITERGWAGHFLSILQMFV